MVAQRFLVRENGYKYDRWVFRVYAGVVILYILFTFNAFDWDFSKQIYMRCDNGLYACENPLFLKCDLPVCFQEFLPPGYEYGIKPERFRKYMFGGWLVAIFGGLAALVINHYWHNRDKRFFEPTQDEEGKK